jgi:hypothetical protein
MAEVEEENQSFSDPGTGCNNIKYVEISALGKKKDVFAVG